MKLLIIILCFLLITCARPICTISIGRDDFMKAIDAGEDCNSIAHCAEGEIDKSILKACLKEKEKIEKKNK